MLTLEETIIDTHDDYNPWAECVVGFNDDGNFVIRYDFTDYDEPESNYILDAVVKKENALVVALFLKIHLIDLPSYLEKKFGEPLNTSTSTEVKHVFEDLINYISACKGDYHLHRTMTERS